MGIANLVVELQEPGGRITTRNTDHRGGYVFAAPKSGPYVIQFREPQGNTRLLDVRQLTAGRDQSLAVTIPKAGTFLSAYSKLQAVESLCACILGDHDPDAFARTLFSQISRGELRGIVTSVMDNLDGIKPTAEQRIVLTAKAQTIQQGLRALPS
jgi:hypothetical protein